MRPAAPTTAGGQRRVSDPMFDPFWARVNEAGTDVDCFRLGKETFQRVLLGRPEIANELSQNMATRRLELVAVRDGLDKDERVSRHASEADRILNGIKGFFAL